MSSHSFACVKDSQGEPPCGRWCGKQNLCLSTRAYHEDYMQLAYERGVRDLLDGACTAKHVVRQLEARLAECLRECEARQKRGTGYGSVSDQWLDQEIAALQVTLGVASGSIASAEPPKWAAEDLIADAMIDANLNPHFCLKHRAELMKLGRAVLTQAINAGVASGSTVGDGTRNKGGADAA